MIAMIAIRRRPALSLSVVALLACLTSPGWAAQQPVPRMEGRVTDLAKVFPAEQSRKLSEELASYEADTTNQVAVLTVPTLSGESLEAFSLRVAKAWALGQKDKDNGILVTLALQERQVRIELGLGLEGTIPQETLNRIVQDDMVPVFRKGDYAGGLESGVRHLLAEARPGTGSSLNCYVDLKVTRAEKTSEVTAEIAEALGLGKDAVGRLGVTKIQATAVGASPFPGKKDNGCSKLAGNDGNMVVRYELSDPRAKKLTAGAEVRLHYMSLAGFAPYGVPGTEIWIFPPKVHP